MQARLAQIMTQAQQQPGSPVAPAPQPQASAQAPAPIVKPPSLMDHLIALRSEVAEMRNEVGFMRQEMANLTAQVEANLGLLWGKTPKVLNSTCFGADYTVRDLKIPTFA